MVQPVGTVNKRRNMVSWDMPLERYPQEELQPGSDAAEVWRFLPMGRFVQFIESGNLYFHRSDLFKADVHEGLPPIEYARYVCAQMGPGHTVEASLRHLEDGRKGFFISCWTEHESVEMWKKFAPEGVALCSRYGLLKAAIDAVPERAMLGLVRYSHTHTGWNTLRFVTTKRPEYSREREVRALLWKLECNGDNPYPHVTPEGLLYPVDVQALVNSIVVSPHAPATRLGEVEHLIAKCGYSIPLSDSVYRRYIHLLPELADINRFASR